MRKIILITITLSLLTLLVLIVRNRSASLSRTKQGKIPVAATFYSLAYFAKQIGDNKIQVTTIVPAGSEPHEYEPTPQNIAAIRSAKLFLFNGGGIDPWAEKIAPELFREGIAFVNAYSLATAAKENPQLLNQPVNAQLLQDPHVWLDPVFVSQITDRVANALVSIDPINNTVYEYNAAEFKMRLNHLDEAYKQGLVSCQKREIIVSHNAFGYLGRRYNFIIHPIAGLSPEEEPSPKKIAELTRLAKEKGIKYIFFETLVSSRLAETIAREVGAGTLVLDPLEGITAENEKQGKNYENIMRENLVNLQKAMQCQ